MVLIGTIGYHHLRDYSVGPRLLPVLEGMTWPQEVRVEELNWGPIAVVQNFQDLPEPYRRVVLLTARATGRPVGTVTTHRWQGGLPTDTAVQARIAEAVTGVISAENLLVIGEHFGIWPDETFLVEVQPGQEEAGDVLSPPVAQAIPELIAAVRRAALWPADRLVTTPLAGHELEAA